MIIRRILNVIVSLPLRLSTSTGLAPDLPRIASSSCWGVRIACAKCPWSPGISNVVFVVELERFRFVVVLSKRVVWLIVVVFWIPRQIGSVATAGQISVTDANDWSGTKRWRVHVRANKSCVEFPSSVISTKSAGINVLWSVLFGEIGSRNAIE